MATTPTKSITTALVTASGSLYAVASKVRRNLTQDGWKVVKARQTDRLAEVLDEIYVDNRRQRQVDLLEEARRIAQSL